MWKFYGELFDVYVFLKSERRHQSVAFNSVATQCVYMYSLKALKGSHSNRKKSVLEFIDSFPIGKHFRSIMCWFCLSTKNVMKNGKVCQYPKHQVFLLKIYRAFNVFSFFFSQSIWIIKKPYYHFVVTENLHSYTVLWSRLNWDIASKDRVVSVCLDFAKATLQSDNLVKLREKKKTTRM